MHGLWGLHKDLSFDGAQLFKRGVKMANNLSNDDSTPMKSKIIGLIIVVILIALGFILAINANESANVSASSGNISWLDYDEGIDQAQTENRTVMLYFHTDWCSWCKKMEAETFKNSDVISESRNFVSIKVDGDDRSDLVERYNVNGYPTVVFINATGKVTNKVVGYQSASQFLDSMGGENNAAEGFICPVTDSWENFLLLLFLPLALIAFMMYLDKHKIKRRPPNNGRKDQNQK
jgi:thiol:disulfide interchange protein